jgi:hypothetical protein
MCSCILYNYITIYGTKNIKFQNIVQDYGQLCHMLIFMNLTNAQHHYVQICYSECHPNWTVNVDSMDINSLMSPIKVWLLLC